MLMSVGMAASNACKAAGSPTNSSCSHWIHFVVELSTELFQLKTKKQDLRTSGCNHGTCWLISLISSTQMRKLTNWKFHPVASTGKIPNIQKRLQLHSSKQNRTKPNHVTPLWSNEQSWSFQLNVRVGACSPSSAPESGCFEKNPSRFFGVIFA